MYCERTPTQFECHHNHNVNSSEYHFEFGEQIEWFGDSATSNFHYKFRVPRMQQMSDDEFRLICKNTIAHVLTFHYIIEYNYELSLKPIQNFIHNSFQLPNHLVINATSLQFQKLLLERNEQKEEMKKMKLIDVSTNLFDTIDQSCVIKIMEYLSLESLVSLSKTNKQMNHLVKSTQSLWKNFFDIHFNPLIFNKYEMKSFERNYLPSQQHIISSLQSNQNKQTQPFQKDTNYYDCIKDYYSSNKRWKTNIPRKRLFLEVNATPIDRVSIAMDKSTILLNNSGYACRIPPYKDKIEQRTFVSSAINGFITFNNELFVSLKTGQINHYKNIEDFMDFTSIKSNKSDYIQFIPYNHYLSWNSHAHSFSIHDLNVYDKIIPITVDNYELLQINQMNPHCFIASTTNKSMIVIDSRTQQVVHETIKQFDNITTFDYYENIIITGNDRGTIWLYDIRSVDKHLDRTIHYGPISQLKCWNRKIVSTSSKGTVGYLNCFENNMYGSRILYNHSSNVISLDFTDDQLVTGTDNGQVFISYF